MKWPDQFLIQPVLAGRCQKASPFVANKMRLKHSKTHYCSVVIPRNIYFISFVFKSCSMLFLCKLRKSDSSKGLRKKHSLASGTGLSLYQQAQAHKDLARNRKRSQCSGLISIQPRKIKPALGLRMRGIPLGAVCFLAAYGPPLELVAL